MLALAKVAAEEAAAAEKAAMLEYKKDNIPAPPEEYADQVNAINKELSEETNLTEVDKRKLLDFLKQAHGDDKPKTKMTLKRREKTEIKKANVLSF